MNLLNSKRHRKRHALAQDHTARNSWKVPGRHPAAVLHPGFNRHREASSRSDFRPSKQTLEAELCTCQGLEAGSAAERAGRAEGGGAWRGKASEAAG